MMLLSTTSKYKGNDEDGVICVRSESRRQDSEVSVVRAGAIDIRMPIPSEPEPESAFARVDVPVRPR